MSRPQTATQTAPSSAPPAPQRTNRMAIWSLVLSILTLGGVGSIAGIWLGAAARRRIPETGERGHGLAVAGIVVGVATLIIAIAYWIFIAMHTGSGGAGGGAGGGGY
jgi:uncharacterized protein DUF4190